MMGQFNTVPSGPRVTFDEEGDNGLVLGDKYLPVEVLIEIFCHVDCETLVACQLVCKRWKMLMSHVWHRKTERALGKPFPWNDKVPWSVFYLACTKKRYERNLIRNHSGAEGMLHWDLVFSGGNHWKIEEPPVGVPELPQAEPMFKDRQICFVTSFQYCIKKQEINLKNEGIHPYILDTYQPPIVVSEWYSCRWDCPAQYELNVKLIGADEEQMDEFQYKDILDGEKQNQWLQKFATIGNVSRLTGPSSVQIKGGVCDNCEFLELQSEVSHVFENYGTGLRDIFYEHGGNDRKYWLGHYGCKTAGACVSVKIPENICTASINDPY